MQSKEVLYGDKPKPIDSDEKYTPDYGVKPILKYIEKITEHRKWLLKYRSKGFRKAYNLNADENKKSHLNKNLIVWCPFDKKDSEFVKQISALQGVDVVFSHIDNEQDFFTYEPDRWDIIVSNPPFKKKRAFFERALDLGKPFALLMTMTCFNDRYPLHSWHERGKQFQLLKFDKRIKFTNPLGEDNTKITFSSGYFCYDFLPKDFIQEELLV